MEILRYIRENLPETVSLHIGNAHIDFNFQIFQNNFEIRVGYILFHAGQIDDKIPLKEKEKIIILDLYKERKMFFDIFSDTGGYRDHLVLIEDASDDKDFLRNLKELREWLLKKKLIKEEQKYTPVEHFGSKFKVTYDPNYHYKISLDDYELLLMECDKNFNEQFNLKSNIVQNAMKKMNLNMPQPQAGSEEVAG